MRGRSRLLAAVVLGVLVLGIAAPAHSAPGARVYRLYKGETSQGLLIGFRVERTDDGRSIEWTRWALEYACEDQTTEFTLNISVRPHIPVTDGAFEVDESNPLDVTHLTGTIGRLRGSGALSVLTSRLTEDQQAQLCATGDLTWEVEYVRTIRRG